MTFLLGNCVPAEAAAIVAPLNLESSQVLLLPINNNEDVARAGGGVHHCLGRAVFNSLPCIGDLVCHLVITCLWHPQVRIGHSWPIGTRELHTVQRCAI
eukprot:SAG31_NODE_22610_length_522_cov_0.680851_1_plen_99_part_00